QVIVGEDGGSALLYDHTAFDGSVMAGVTNHCYDYVKKSGSFEASEDNGEAAPQKLEFVLGPDTLDDIEKAKSSQARTIGTPVMVFGAASTRQFLHGRATVYHSSSKDSLSFCKVFDSPSSSGAEKEESLRNAVARCKQDAVSVSV
ncbi:unnamed protein product, partial [Ixodes persulcatus]